MAKATINSLERREQLLRGDVERYLELQQLGAISLEGLELRQLKLLALQQELALARAELARQQVKLPDSELRAPFAGTVLAIAARPGERAGADGVLQLGRSNAMQALLEVYESDVDRVRIGQLVRLDSENGGFDGTLRGRVIRIRELAFLAVAPCPLGLAASQSPAGEAAHCPGWHQLCGHFDVHAAGVP